MITFTTSIRTVLRWIVVFGGLAIGTACTPVGTLVGAGAIAGSTALQERGIEQALADTATELSIQQRIINQDLETFQRLGFTVVEGRVLLTGIVPNAEDRGRAIQLTWQTSGVTEVINEILIGEDIGIIDTAYDVKIAKALELDLTLDRDVQAVNYIIQTHNGTVFVMGVAQNQTELDRVTAHAKNVARVRQVVSYAQIRDSDARKANLLRLAELTQDQNTAPSSDAEQPDNPSENSDNR